MPGYRDYSSIAHPLLRVPLLRTRRTYFIRLVETRSIIFVMEGTAKKDMADGNQTPGFAFVGTGD